MKKLCLAMLAVICLAAPAAASAAGGPPISDDTQACLGCHVDATPGIVNDWRRSRHARTTPQEAMAQKELKRKVSAEQVPKKYFKTVVGCAECHVRPAKDHPDSFAHDEYKIHVVVSPKDCAACHPEEESQYRENLMSHAYANLHKNPLYQDLALHINGDQEIKGDKIVVTPPDELTKAESCYYCHGTKIVRTGWRNLTNDYGDFKFPVYQGWPNHGVGRINPDGSKGSCGACHSRHQFSIRMARSPSTCSECHKGPDVPAYKVYQVSKHGTIYRAMNNQWDMDAVPWAVGRDFTAPTCAACHASLLTDGQGNVLAKRTHAMTDRLWVRLIGLIYSHPQPKQPETWKIKNADGLTLATSFDGKPAMKYLIGPAEQKKRKLRMTQVCTGCHSTGWVAGQMARMDQSNKDADAAVKAATELVIQSWNKGLCQGPPQNASPFDEYLERLWVGQWLFYANSVRFASAMTGADYGVFEQGRWDTTGKVRRMHDWLKSREGKK